MVLLGLAGVRIVPSGAFELPTNWVKTSLELHRSKTLLIDGTVSEVQTRAGPLSLGDAVFARIEILFYFFQ